MASNHAFVLLPAAPAEDRAATLALPSRPCCLVVGPRRKPRLIHTPPRVGFGTTALDIVLEPVTVHNRDFVLMLVGDAHTRHGGPRPTLHNGLPARPVTLMRIKDELQVGHHRFVLAAKASGSVSTATAEQAGATCPLCRYTIAEGARIYVCSHCRVALHCDDHTVAEDARLACAEMLTACPNCSRAITFQEGVGWRA